MRMEIPKDLYQQYMETKYGDELFKIIRKIEQKML